MPGKVVPVYLWNLTGESINLYSRASIMAVLLKVTGVMNNHPEDLNTVENTFIVSAVSDDNRCPPLEEMLMESMKGTSLSSHHQDLLLALLIDYLDVLARSRDELGHIDVLQHEIITDGVPHTHQQF